MAPTSYYIYVLKGSIEVAEQNKGQGAQDINELIKVRRNKLSDLQANGKDPFKITKYDVTAHSEDIKSNYDEYDGEEVCMFAGRIMSKRVMGKASILPYIR